jgi:hypothetical protein
MPKGHNVQLEELPMAKTGTIYTANKAVEDYDSNHKISIHEFILI